jgi:hypothetical protein
LQKAALTFLGIENPLGVLGPKFGGVINDKEVPADVITDNHLDDLLTRIKMIRSDCLNGRAVFLNDNLPKELKKAPVQLLSCKKTPG